MCPPNVPAEKLQLHPQIVALLMSTVQTRGGLVSGPSQEQISKLKNERTELRRQLALVPAPAVQKDILRQLDDIYVLLSRARRHDPEIVRLRRSF